MALMVCQRCKCRDRLLLMTRNHGLVCNRCFENIDRKLSKAGAGWP